MRKIEKELRQRKLRRLRKREKEVLIKTFDFNFFSIFFNTSKC